MKTDLIKIFFKVLIYALGLLATYFGVSSLAACSVDRHFIHQGTGYFQYFDTLHLYGQSDIYYPIKSH